MYTIMRFLKRMFASVKTTLVDFYYNQLVAKFWPYENSVRLWWILLGILALIIVVIINLLINYKQTILSIIKLKQIIHTRNI